MTFFRQYTTLVALLWAAIFTLPATSRAEDITLQLKFRHQFQFAGYYTALDKGYYKEEGLTVSIVEGNTFRSPLKQLLDGKADFAVHNSEGLLEYLRGEPVVAVAAIFQHSPGVLISRADSTFSSPASLKGHRIALNQEHDAEVLAMLAGEGVTKDNTEFIDLTDAPARLSSHDIEATAAYSTNEAHILREMGLPIREISPISYGIDFYGDCLYTTTRLTETSPQLVERFLRATVKGWNYALRHPEEIVSLIQSKYAPQRSRNHLMVEAQELRKHILPDLVPLGTMNHARWEHIAAAYQRLGFTNSTRDVSGFIFAPETVNASTFEKLLIGASSAVAIAIAGILALIAFNKRLKTAVAERTSELEEYKQTMETIMTVSPSGLLLGRGRVLQWASPALTTLLGYEDLEFKGMDARKLYASNAEHRRAGGILIDALESSGTATLDATLRRKDGTNVDVFMTMRHLDFADPERGYIAAMMDITDRKRNEEGVRLAAQVFRQSSDSIIITDRNNNIVEVNKTFTRLTGYQPEEVMGKQPNKLKSGRHGSDFYGAMWKSISSKGSWSGEIWNRKKDGELFPAWLRITTLKDASGSIVNFIGTFSDLTQEKKSAESIYRLNNFDVLTELPNRALFMSLLGQEIQHAHDQSSGVGVILFDIDNFKTVNESMGIISGDQLLQETGRRLTSAFDGGYATARFGSDEFALMVPAVQDSEAMAQVIRKLRDVIAPAFSLAGGEVFLTCSMGIALFPDDATDADELLVCAENALHHAREMGVNSYAFFSSEMTERASERLLLENALRHALARSEFQLYYQPKVDLQSATLQGAEALIRWNHPEWGIVSPGRFIPVLEMGDLIIPVGEWVIREACHACRRMHDSGLSNLRMAVNLSPRQFLGCDIVSIVRAALKDAKLEPQYIEVEITEAILVQDVVRVAQTLQSLKQLGVTIAVDDFGTGYSSLSYLSEFTLDTLKIDRAFIKDVEHNPKSAAITSTIKAMAQTLELSVVAEGVENEAQMDFLRSLGCVTIQGYIYSPPLPEDEFKAWATSRPAPLTLPDCTSPSEDGDNE